MVMTTMSSTRVKPNTDVGLLDIPERRFSETLLQEVPVFALVFSALIRGKDKEVRDRGSGKTRKSLFKNKENAKDSRVI